MLKRLANAVVAAALACMVLGFWAQSSQAQPQSQQTEHSEKRAEPGTNEHKKPKSIRERLSIIWDRTWDDPVAFYTFVLGIFTALLAVISFAQVGFLIRADKTARIAANAANRSARAAIGLQLPIIRVMLDQLGWGDSIQSGEQTELCSVNNVTVYNFGSTKAFPKEIVYGFVFGNDLPSEPSYQFMDKFPPNRILEPDRDRYIIQTLSGTLLLKKGQREKIMKGNCLWFYCCILYDDFMDERRTHGFCWRWSYVGMGLDWRIDTTPAYNRKT